MNTAHFFNDYFNNAEVNNVLVMEPDGTIRNVSKSFTKSFGYSKEEIVGKNFEILFTD